MHSIMTESDGSIKELMNVVMKMAATEQENKTVKVILEISD